MQLIAFEHIGELCRNGWADQEAVWIVDSIVGRSTVAEGTIIHALVGGPKGHFFEGTYWDTFAVGLLLS